ncbi:MAG TPA: hypothetical protein VL361_09005 [Candidatus Limnocylindrales bacterium]|nr:hypothetical protein [Candidatus Limnocylindrales bacterium]
MSGKLKTIHITLTPQIAQLLEAEVAAGRFAGSRSQRSLEGLCPGPGCRAARRIQNDVSL